MSKTLFQSALLAVICILPWPGTHQALAQIDDEPGDYAPADTIFVEISLSEDGVWAVDSAGYDWYYDFELGSFVEGILPEVPEGEGREDGDVVSGFTPVEERCTIEKRVKEYTYGNVKIDEDEFVGGNVKASGQITVRGWVQGRVYSNDRVLVKNGGRVDGDVIAPKIIVQRGGSVLGDQVTTDVSLDDLKDWGEAFSVSGIIAVISTTVLFLFCGFLVVTLMPRQMNNFSECITASTVKSYALGLIFIFLLPFLMILISITIVGIVLLPIVPFVYVAAIIMGVVACANRIGRFLAVRFFGGEQSTLLQTMVGTLALMVPWFVTAILLGSPEGSTTMVLGWVLFGLTTAASTFPLFTGIGSAYLTRFGFRSLGDRRQRPERPGRGPAPAPAPPPIPNTPPEPPLRPFPDQTDETSSSDLRKE